MRKHPTIGLILALLLAGAAAQAAGPFRIGLRYWYPQWEVEELAIRIVEDWEVGGVQGEDYDAPVDTVDTSSVGMLGPEISARMGRLELAASVRYGEFDLRFEGEARRDQSGYLSTAAYNFETRVARWDAEGMARWALGNHLRLQAGYRLMSYRVDSQEFFMRRTLQGVDLGSTQEELEEYQRRRHGPVVGLTGHRGLGAGLYLYGTALYLPWLHASEERSGDRESVVLTAQEEDRGHGYSGEIGLGWRLPGWVAAWSASIRAERYRVGDAEETFWGAAVGVAFP